MFKNFLATAVLLLSMSPSFALDGNDLYKMCATPNGQPVKGICIGYVRGFIEGMRGQAWIDKTQPVFCIPDNMQYSQAVDIVTIFLRDTPEQRHQDSGILVMAAMAKAYPCGSSKK